jgi:hypothetical protein
MVCCSRKVDRLSSHVLWRSAAAEQAAKRIVLCSAFSRRCHCAFVVASAKKSEHHVWHASVLMSWRKDAATGLI